MHRLADSSISRRALLLGSVSSPVLAAVRLPAAPDAVDWPAFLARHDLIWTTLPRSWGEAPFLGNGRLALALIERTPGVLSFTIDNVDVFDRRDFSWGWHAYSRARYHVGDFRLRTVGKVLATQLRLDLYRAELTGTVTTDRGAVRLLGWVHADQPHMRIEIEPIGDEAGCTWEWHPTPAVSTRPPIRTAADQAKYQHDYGHPVRIWVDNPPGEQRDSGAVRRWFQPLLAGGGYTTAWTEQREPSGKRTLIVSNAMSFPDLASLDTSANAVRAATRGRERQVATHRAWWEKHFHASFVTLPDTRIESFYWIQVYKTGCIARADTGVIDTHGPWLQPSNWPYLTWNLNVQISYYPLQSSNRLPLAEGLFQSLDRHRDALARTAQAIAPGALAIGHCTEQDLESPLDVDRRYEREVGNLLWVCHLYWLQYRFTMNQALLRDRLLPLLRGAAALYLPLLHEKPDGRLHLAPTYSPEFGTTADCSYDLALLRWATTTLVDCNTRLRLDDPLAARWRDIAARLASYSVDEHGYRVGADLTVGAHRHFSHLMMIYPLYLENRDTPAKVPLIERSTARWLDLAAAAGQGSGWTLATGASFHAALGHGNAALADLKALLASSNGIGRSFPNTMYAESGQNIETPLAAMQAIQDMLLQSWGSVLRVFPAVPDAWRDLAFRDLRGEGAFLVDARRTGGRTAWIRVKSLAGEPCVVEADWGGIVPMITKGAHLTRVGSNRFSVSLRRGEQAVLHLPGVYDFTATPLPAEPGATNSYGVHPTTI